MREGEGGRGEEGKHRREEGGERVRRGDGIREGINGRENEESEGKRMRREKDFREEVKSTLIMVI